MATNAMSDVAAIHSDPGRLLVDPEHKQAIRHPQVGFTLLYDVIMNVASHFRLYLFIFGTGSQLDP